MPETAAGLDVVELGLVDGRALVRIAVEPQPDEREQDAGDAGDDEQRPPAESLDDKNSSGLRKARPKYWPIE